MAHEDDLAVAYAIAMTSLWLVCLLSLWISNWSVESDVVGWLDPIDRLFVSVRRWHFSCFWLLLHVLWESEALLRLLYLDFFLLFQLFDLYAQDFFFLFFGFYLLVDESLRVSQKSWRSQIIILKMFFLFLQFVRNAVHILTWKVNVFNIFVEVKFAVNIR